MGWEEKAAKAKKGHRPSLKNWERDGLARTFPLYAESMLNSNHPYSSFQIVNNCGGESKSGKSCNGGSSHYQNYNGGCSSMRGEVVERNLSLECVRRAAASGCASNGNGRGSNNSNRSETMLMYPVVLEASEVPPEEFHERYEAECIPAVIRNIPYGATCSNNDNDRNDGTNNHNPRRRSSYCDDGDVMMDEEEEKKECDNSGHSRHHDNVNNNGREWPAVRRWKLDALAIDPDLSNRSLKCGEDDDGYTIRMKLRYFLQYMNHNNDDSPLYIFDATFDEDRYAKRILEDYTVPEYFDEDLLGLVGERRRPPYRWFLVGPCRSGTTVHIDPLGTSAWNTLIHGVKRWVLFPPHVPKSVVKGRKLILPGEDDEAIHYFTTILPRMKRKAAASGGKGEYSNFTCYEFTQYAGETVFVPHGWWHAVLNITNTVGITQNYCSRRNFDVVWTATRSGRKKMSCTWLRRLNEHHPDLARRARELNRRDSFVMWEDDPDEQRRWRKKKSEKERKKRERRDKKKAKEKKKDRGEHRTTERRRNEETIEDVVMKG